MIEVPYRFLTAGVKHEDRGRQQLGRCEGLDALPGGSISELSEAVELRALRKAALFINVLHVACPSEPGALRPRSVESNDISVRSACNRSFCAFGGALRFALVSSHERLAVAISFSTVQLV